MRGIDRIGKLRGLRYLLDVGNEFRCVVLSTAASPAFFEGEGSDCRGWIAGINGYIGVVLDTSMEKLAGRRWTNIPI
jgi:hypothetical protein